MSARKGAAAPLAAYVLQRWDWSESSLIVDLFTRERGRVVVAAKGAKRPTSQLRPVLLPFQRIQVQLGRTPADDAAEVHLLRSAEWAGGVPWAGGAALFAGFYLNELLLRLLARQDPHPALFDAYADTLVALCPADEAARQAARPHEAEGQATKSHEAARQVARSHEAVRQVARSHEAARQVALRAFELMLLRELGVLPELGRVTQTQEPLRADAAYALDAEHGVAPVRPGAAGVPGAALMVIEPALACAGEDRGPALRRAAAPVAAALRGPLRTLLHYHLGTPQLRTRQVMLGLQKLLEPHAARR